MSPITSARALRVQCRACSGGDIEGRSAPTLSSRIGFLPERRGGVVKKPVDALDEVEVPRQRHAVGFDILVLAHRLHQAAAPEPSAKMMRAGLSGFAWTKPTGCAASGD